MRFIECAESNVACMQTDNMEIASLFANSDSKAPSGARSQFENIVPVLQTQLEHALLCELSLVAGHRADRLAGHAM